ncbi:cation:proton antiporter [Actinomycetospora chibensis]|uniref:Cation:proton antiporter n=1 Tax=Actinomycetospora chibensis TaxID=663606 RepID=A0ABV9REK8_9PSEU|nr:cation:proton antiporter [Actinomycetospora chibensis]MDD7925002.1 cation:proton antiporter [Actinomycetospora chibensis]
MPVTTAILVVTATIFAWGLVSARLQRADVTAPIVFVAIGSIIAVLGLVDPFTAPERLKPLVELTLVWVLFCDAARVRVSDLRRDMGRDVRLLGIGLPLSVALGWVLALWLVPGLDVWLALLVAAALAPTDAALGVPVVTNRAVPARVRRLITVESGLNDGIVTPLVVAAIAGAASAEGLAGAGGVGMAVAELAIGVVVGVALGFGGGALLRWARRRGWSAEDFAGIAVLALAIGCYLGAVAVGGNGFVAAFCGGLAFGAAAGRRERAETVFLEQASGLVSLLVWMAFGFIAVPIMLRGPDLIVVVYAVLSLTLVRMLPVALALIGTGLDRRTVLFVGWFGPRGLASLVFALLAVEELGPRADPAVLAIGMTVLISVLAHGISAAPPAVRYGNAVSAHGTEPQGAIPDIPVRGLPRRRETDEVQKTGPTPPPPPD